MAFEEILDALKQLSQVIVTASVNFIEKITGWTIPPWIIQLLAIGILLFSFWKWSKRLPWLILVLLGLFLASFLLDLFS